MNDPFIFARRAHGGKPSSEMVGRSLKLTRAARESKGEGARSLEAIADWLLDLSNHDLPPSVA